MAPKRLKTNEELELIGVRVPESTASSMREWADKLEVSINLLVTRALDRYFIFQERKEEERKAAKKAKTSKKRRAA